MSKIPILITIMATWVLESSRHICAQSVETSASGSSEVEPVLDTLLDGLEVDLRTVEDSDGLGLDVYWLFWDEESYGLGSNSGEVATAWGLRSKAELEGFIGTESAEDDNTPRQISFNLDFYKHSIFSEYDVNVPGVGNVTQDWWIDYGVSAAQFEADQDFETINYVFKPFVTLPIPYSENIELLARQLLGGGDRRVRPVFVTGSYAIASELDGGNGAEGGLNRWEIALNYKIFELSEGISFTARNRVFWEEGDSFNLLELEAGVPINETVTALVKYVDGELPLSLRASESVSVGFSIHF
jgi:hypothetical protein